MSAQGDFSLILFILQTLNINIKIRDDLQKNNISKYNS